MAVTKRLRYEILRRDNHACRYCGATAPEVKLVVDHVVPVALGGSDEPANLVAACEPCNSGKSASSPDAPIVEDVAQDALRWSRAMQRAVELQDEQAAAVDAQVAEIGEFWDSLNPSWWNSLEREDDWENGLGRLVRGGIRVDDFKKATAIAMASGKIAAEDMWRYACGVCWRMLDDRQRAARRLIDAGEV